uniref:Uncharacterized protein n=1 Tax=Anopheles stephensi TaxID=30069 RepID=A0A182Y388_ANOST
MENISSNYSVIKQCNELQLLNQHARALCEWLGEECPEVLGSILCALQTILNLMDVRQLTSPLKQLLLHLLPILKNRHEKVQENFTSLVGLIAQLALECVSASERMPICWTC